MLAGLCPEDEQIAGGGDPGEDLQGCSVPVFIALPHHNDLVLRCLRSAPGLF